MLKTLLTGSGLTLMLAACATAPPELATKLAARATAPPAAGCVPDTATRIPVKADECAGFGPSFSQAELLRTGARDTAGALRVLDPALSIAGGH